MAKQKWYYCEMDGFSYPEDELVIHADTGLLVCKNCLLLLNELDQEQEDIEEMRREDMKMKAGLFDKEGR